MLRSRPLAGVLAAVLVSVAGAALAAPVAFDDPRLQAQAALTVSVPGLAANRVLPVNYAADGRNLSPPLTWSVGPATTRSYTVVMQDSDAAGGKAQVHWIVYDIAPGVTALPRGMKNLASPSKPLGAAQGANDHGSFGYSGPRLTLGEPPHHYIFQVFALDRVSRVRAGATLEAVERAMAGHVIARGELVTTYSPPQAKTPRAPDGTPAPSPAPPG